MECDYVINCRCVVISSLDGPLQRNWKELGIPKSSTTRHDFHDTAAQVTFSTNIWHQRTGWSLHLVHPSIVYPATKIRSFERPKSWDRFSPRKSNSKLEGQWTHRLYPLQIKLFPCVLIAFINPASYSHGTSLGISPLATKLQETSAQIILCCKNRSLCALQSLSAAIACAEHKASASGPYC